MTWHITKVNVGIIIKQISCYNLCCLLLVKIVEKQQNDLGLLVHVLIKDFDLLLKYFWKDLEHSF
jgi:hypothetical protein